MYPALRTIRRKRSVTESVISILRIVNGTSEAKFTVMRYKSAALPYIKSLLSVLQAGETFCV